MAYKVRAAPFSPTTLEADDRVSDVVVGVLGADPSLQTLFAEMQELPQGMPFLQLGAATADIVTAVAVSASTDPTSTKRRIAPPLTKLPPG